MRGSLRMAAGVGAAYPEADSHDDRLMRLFGLAVAETPRLSGRFQRLSGGRSAILRGQLITPSLEVEQWRLNRQAFILLCLGGIGRV